MKKDYQGGCHCGRVRSSQAWPYWSIPRIKSVDVKQMAMERKFQSRRR